MFWITLIRFLNCKFVEERFYVQGRKLGILYSSHPRRVIRRAYQLGLVSRASEHAICVLIHQICHFSFPPRLFLVVFSSDSVIVLVLLCPGLSSALHTSIPVPVPYFWACPGFRSLSFSESLIKGCLLSCCQYQLDSSWEMLSPPLLSAPLQPHQPVIHGLHQLLHFVGLHPLSVPLPVVTYPVSEDGWLGTLWALL